LPKFFRISLRIGIRPCKVFAMARARLMKEFGSDKLAPPLRRPGRLRSAPASQLPATFDSTKVIAPSKQYRIYVRAGDMTNIFTETASAPSSRRGSIRSSMETASAPSSRRGSTRSSTEICLGQTMSCPLPCRERGYDALPPLPQTCAIPYESQDARACDTEGNDSGSLEEKCGAARENARVASGVIEMGDSIEHGPRHSLDVLKFNAFDTCCCRIKRKVQKLESLSTELAQEHFDQLSIWNL